MVKYIYRLLANSNSNILSFDHLEKVLNTGKEETQAKLMEKSAEIAEKVEELKKKLNEEDCILLNVGG